MARRGAGEPPTSPSAPAAATTPLASTASPEPANLGGAVDRVGAALGLTLAGVSAPIAVAAMATTSGLLGSPLVESALVGLLVIAPAGVGLATALLGLRRVAAALDAQGGSEAEQAVLRVFVGTLMFFYALALAAVTVNSGDSGPDLPPGYSPPLYLPIAAFGLVAAWCILLHVILWPGAPPVRRCSTMALDLMLLSAFLHFGGGAVAGWYPLYLLFIFHAGFRFGLGALVGTAIGSILGFAAVVLSTEIWQRRPVLALGLILTLAVLPALIAGAIRAIAAAREATAQAEADRTRILALIADNLRGPLAQLAQLGQRAKSGAAARVRGPDEPVLTARRLRAVASRIDDVADFAALEAGTFAAPFEVFDLRALVNRTLVPLQGNAAEKGVALRWRIDPRLPFRLRGPAQAFERILGGLASHAVEAAPAGAVRIGLDQVAGDARRLRLRLFVENAGAYREPGLTQGLAPGLAPGEGALALVLVRRLVALIGGEFAIDRTPGQPSSGQAPSGQAPSSPAPSGQSTRLTVTLALAIEEGAAGPTLDLGNRAVLIATEDGEFAGELAELLYEWNADARWVGDADAALSELSRRGTPGYPVAPERPVLIIDGRGRLLSALSLVHHAAQLGDEAPFVLLVTDPGPIESLGDADQGELHDVIRVPVSEELLANALHGLPLEPLAPDRPATKRLADPLGGKRSETAEPTEHTAAIIDPARAGAPIGARAGARIGVGITPIATHPKFVPDTAATLDMRAIEGLCALGGGPGFLRELVETFRVDAQQIMERIDQAAATADEADFAMRLSALRRAASPLGGTQLCVLLASLQGLTAGELRQQGAVHVQRLDAEIDRLAAALLESLPAAEARLP